MHRRKFLRLLGRGAVGLAASDSLAQATGGGKTAYGGASDDSIRLFLCGDVMTGRGIDQIMPYSCDPRIQEPYLTSARDYVKIAQRANGPIPYPVSFDYVWGDALTEWRRFAPDLRIVNLETAITRSASYWPGKGIHYRMHPQNTPCLNAAGIDACVLANNHVLDWGREGLLETLASLRRAGIESAGAGRGPVEAQAPAIFELPGQRRVLLFAVAHRSSGIPGNWQASPGQPGVALLKSFSKTTVDSLGERISAIKRSGDLALVSIHWGGNWGYPVPPEQRRFAHLLIDNAGVDIVHGHSSHHPKAIELYRQRPIFYGCGDFLNDYEGISGYQAFRDDLTLMYFVNMNPHNGRLLQLRMIPLQIRQFRLHYPAEQDIDWLWQTMDRECAAFGTRVTRREQGTLELDVEA